MPEINSRIDESKILVRRLLSVGQKWVTPRVATDPIPQVHVVHLNPCFDSILIRVRMLWVRKRNPNGTI